MKKYKVGYTTGAYDMFHIGHLNLLKRAKEKCERLIVGVSTDSLIQSAKGKTPVIPYEERFSIVDALELVDEVVPQMNKDKFAAWEKYRFDVMFVGDDWKGKPLFAEAEEMLRAVGVDVVYFPYTKNVSSTGLKTIITNLENSYE